MPQMYCRLLLSATFTKKFEITVPCMPDPATLTVDSKFLFACVFGIWFGTLVTKY